MAYIVMAALGPAKALDRHRYRPAQTVMAYNGYGLYSYGLGSYDLYTYGL